MRSYTGVRVSGIGTENKRWSVCTGKWTGLSQSFGVTGLPCYKQNLIFIFGQNEETKKQRKTTFGRFLLKELINVFGMENVRHIRKAKTIWTSLSWDSDVRLDKLKYSINK